MLRVLVLVDHARGISGPHRNVVGSLNALSRREDVSVRLLCREIDDREPYAHSNRIEIRLGYAPHAPFRVINNLRRVVAAARGCDAIYVPSGLKSLLYAQVARSGRRLVAGPNVTPLPIHTKDSPGRLELRYLCDCWVENSKSRRAHVVRCTADLSVRVVPHAIDIERWGPHRHDASVWERVGVPTSGLKLLYVGRDNEARKGVAQLLDAFELVRQRRPADSLQLILAGRMSTSTTARALELDSVYALGFLGTDILPQVYASADISVVPSSWESFGFTVLEGMASGIAVVASNSGGIPEQIVDGTSGRLVNIAEKGRTGSVHRPDAAERLAGAILELIDNPDLRARLGAGGRRRALDQFTEARLADDLVAVLRG